MTKTYRSNMTDEEGQGGSEDWIANETQGTDEYEEIPFSEEYESEVRICDNDEDEDGDEDENDDSDEDDEDPEAADDEEKHEADGNNEEGDQACAPEVVQPPMYIDFGPLYQHISVWDEPDDDWEYEVEFDPIYQPYQPPVILSPEEMAARMALLEAHLAALTKDDGYTSDFEPDELYEADLRWEEYGERMSSPEPEDASESDAEPVPGTMVRIEKHLNGVSVEEEEEEEEDWDVTNPLPQYQHHPRHHTT